jgi:hypothetical protein
MKQSHGPTEEMGMPGSGVMVSNEAQRITRDDDLARTTECPSRTHLTLVRLTGLASCKIHRDPLANAILAERGRIAAW